MKKYIMAILIWIIIIPIRVHIKSYREPKLPICSSE